MKYKGVYRLKCDIDLTTNDYPRDENGGLETDDIYIKCANNCRIYHYGKSILVAYIPSIIRGHNVLKRMYIEEFGEQCGSIRTVINCLLDRGVILSYIENDSEIEFKFRAKNINRVAKLLKAQTNGAGISPFSTRNLPKSDYVIPEEDLLKYKDILENKYVNRSLEAHKITLDFLNSIATKKNTIKDIKTDMKLKCMKPKEYIHSIGMFQKYLDYLEENA